MHVYYEYRIKRPCITYLKADLSYLACIQQSNKNEANNEINYLLRGEFECKSANSRYILLSCNPKFITGLVKAHR